MAIRVCQSVLVVLFVVFGGRLIRAEESLSASSSSVCHVSSATDLIFRPRECLPDGNPVNIAEGGEASLQRALNTVQGSSQEYVSVLFYASWCPFSRTCREAFTILSSLYPSIRHFAVEDSAVKPSTLAKYRIHGFPTLFLINSSTRVRYNGPRNISSLVMFYADVTGMKPISVDRMFLENIKNPSNLVKLKNTEETGRNWARFPENLIRQESYLALATTFVLLRLLYVILPTLLASAHGAWTRHVHNASLLKSWVHLLTYLGQSIRLSKLLKEPCKTSNLQEGALNAKGWASKSLASVSIGDASSSWGLSKTNRQ